MNYYNNAANAIRIRKIKGNIGARHISILPWLSSRNLKHLQMKIFNVHCQITTRNVNDEKRSSMMPVNNAFPLKELIQACKDYIAKTNRRISFEYALAKDNNDNLEDAKELVPL
ncbi:MAG: hypothetical protein V8R51_07945 [Clostridia bacterium]